MQCDAFLSVWYVPISRMQNQGFSTKYGLGGGIEKYGFGTQKC